ncbi:hypothetical protein WUBG_14970 [Wuchereria bancrofti]|uniref:Uncharacterized protein n=1 Tax=Wuchereria bancrofti TaxID=6293 RepID=J9DWR1_WUCBA|nr:hypothetical protein WUBG_14970 [Wuchereria bancrofti]
MKKIGIEKIGELRKELIQALWMKRNELKRTKMDSWTRVTDVKLQTFNEYLYKAFKEHYKFIADMQIFTFSKRISINAALIRKGEGIGTFWLPGYYGLTGC